MYYVYIAECGDTSLYTGWTMDIERRIQQHNEAKGAKYTRSRLPIKLKYYEQYDTKSEAMKRECEIKGLSRAKKLALIKEYIKSL